MLHTQVTVALFSIFVGLSVVGPMTKKFRIRKTLMVSLAIGITGSVVHIFFPDSMIVLMTAGQLPSFSIIPLICVRGAMNTMTMDCNDYLFGNKIVGMSAAATSFSGKVASGLGGSLISWILAAVNYDSTAAVATAAMRYGIYACSIYISLAMMVALLLTKRYPPPPALLPRSPSTTSSPTWKRSANSSAWTPTTSPKWPSLTPT